MRTVMFPLLFFALASGGAAAQDAPPQDEPTPAVLAAAILEQAGVTDLFDVVPDDEHVRIRHRASGMICRFNTDREPRIVVFDGLPRGEDVGCDYEEMGSDITLYFTRYAEPTTIEEQIGIANNAIINRFANAKPYETTMEMTRDGLELPASLTVQYTISDSAGKRFTRASVAMHNGWVIKMRYTSGVVTEEELGTQVLFSSMEWMLTLLAAVGEEI